MNNSIIVGLRERLESWFPDREFFMRSQGQVRFIKVSSRLQKITAGVAVTALVVWAATMATIAITQYSAQHDQMVMLDREAKVASAEDRVDAYRSDLGQVTQDLSKRQDIIEAMTNSLNLPSQAGNGDTVSDSTSEATETVTKVSAVIPEAAALAEIEARQIAFVERLTRYADDRAERTAQAIRKLGLNPKQILASAQIGLGGPLEILSTSRDGSLDPRFERLGLSLARMEALEHGLNSIPQVLPADRGSISSGFGYRRDPFTGRSAMHSGLDFKAGYGSPILAAANGTVSFVGVRSGYGKVVEISHGNGMMTRYAHMSAFRTTKGQEVAAGDLIGAIGSTGRSTGPHLHFEVRINDRAVNPRPFLEAAPHVLEEARSTTAHSNN